MLCPDLHEGVQSAWRDIQAKPFVEQLGDLAVRAPFAAEFANQFAVWFEL
jgi:hypothetical protein